MAQKTDEIRERYKGEQPKAKPTLEEYLDALERKDPKVIKLAFVNLDAESQIDVINEFTATGQEKYKRILGLTEE